MELINRVKELIKQIESKRDSLEVTDYFSEDDYEEFLHEVYAWEETYYHIRKIDPIMFRQDYLNHCDLLERDGFFEGLDDYKELTQHIEDLEELLSDIGDGIGFDHEEYDEFKDRYFAIIEEVTE
jgi:hypothetical protein